MGVTFRSASRTSRFFAPPSSDSAMVLPLSAGEVRFHKTRVRALVGADCDKCSRCLENDRVGWDGIGRDGVGQWCLHAVQTELGEGAGGG